MPPKRKTPPSDAAAGHDRRPAHVHDAAPFPGDEDEYELAARNPGRPPAPDTVDHGPAAEYHAWLETGGHGAAYAGGSGAERAALAAELARWLHERGHAVPWRECADTLADMYAQYTLARREASTAGFDADGRPRLGALLAAAEHAEADAGDDRARHYAAGLRVHVRARLDAMCGDWARLSAVFGAGEGERERERERGPEVGPDAERPQRPQHGGAAEGEAFEDLLLRTAPPRGTDPAEDAARDAALAAYRATKRAASTAVAAAGASAAAAAEETKQRALVELARLAHEIDPSLRPVVAYRTALTMYVAQRQTLGG